MMPGMFQLPTGCEAKPIGSAACIRSTFLEASFCPIKRFSELLIRLFCHVALAFSLLDGPNPASTIRLELFRD